MLGRYEVVKHLARGGMADLSVARARGLEGFERHVVIKHLRPEDSADAAFVKMFVTEARLAGSLHHHNIVQVHDIGQEDGRHFFAMEYVHGEDLRRLLSQLRKSGERPPIEHVVTIISAVAAALHHAHEHKGQDHRPLGIVHRDVTPGNIIVAYDGNVKVVDFGIAKAAVGPSDTQVGMLKGKVPYMSPEQCTGKPLDRRSDVFALGIVLYELVTVRRLFQGANEFHTMCAVISGDIPPPSKHRPDLPKALGDIIMKALSRKPSDRYQSADEMRIALDGFAEQARLRTSTTALADYMKQLFGERPEPWMGEEPLHPEIDDYKTEPGVVTIPIEALDKREIPKSVSMTRGCLIEQARLTAISNGLDLVHPPVAKPKLPIPSIRSLGVARPAADAATRAASPPPAGVRQPPVSASPPPAPPAPEPAGVPTEIDDKADASPLPPPPSVQRLSASHAASTVSSIRSVSHDREPTMIVSPLPKEGIRPRRATAVGDGPRGRLARSWLVAGGLGAFALAIAVVLVMNPSSQVGRPAEPVQLDMKAAATPAQPDPDPPPAEPPPVVAKQPPSEPTPPPSEPTPPPSEITNKPTPTEVAVTPPPTEVAVTPPPIEAAAKPTEPEVTEPAKPPAPRPILRKPPVTRPAVKPAKLTRTTKPTKPTKPPAWDPDALFLKKK
ncbi:MAG: Protein kinase [Deltaproteobacteria bacterium]|nr:Protein kinase [Deltaproteobacteria bacterium]